MFLSRRAFLGGAALLAGAACAGPSVDRPIPRLPGVQPTPRGTPPRVVVPIRLSHELPTQDVTPVIYFPEILQEAGLPYLGRVYQLTTARQEGWARACQRLMAGEVDIITLDILNFARAIEQGLLTDVRIISSAVTDGVPRYHSVVFRTLATNPIATAADLRGRTISGGPAGGPSDFALRSWLRRGGLNLERDVTINAVELDAVPAAVREGRLSLGPYVQPWDAIEAARGSLRDVVTLGEIWGPSEGYLHVARQEWLRVNEFAVRAWQIDRAKGLGHVLGPGRGLAIQTMAKAYDTFVATFQLYFATLKDAYRPLNGCAVAERIQRPADVLRDAGAFKERLDAARWLDLQYLPDPC